MAKVHVSKVIERPVEEVWAFTRSFESMKAWNPDIVELHIEDGLLASQTGCIRNFTLKNGANVRETLLAYSEPDRSFTYNILSSPMPVKSYVATFTCRPVTEGNHTLVEWWAEFEVAPEKEADVKRHVGRNVFAGGMELIEKAMASRS